MALGISRTYLGGVLSRQAFVNRVASSSRTDVCSALVHPGLSPAARGYATASAALTKRRPVTAKSTRKDAHAVPPPPPKNVVSHTPHKKTTSPEMETAHHTAEVLPTHDQVVQEKVEEDKEAQVAKKYTEMTEEEKMKELERMMTLSDLMPTVDPWGQSILDTLDVVIPYRINYKSLSKETLEHIKANFINSVKNSTALSTMANLDAIPGVYLHSGRQSFFSKFRQTLKVFGTQSVEPDALLTPFRAMALENYQELNRAIANRSDKEIKKYTTFDYQTHALELARVSKSKNPKARFIWQLHRTLEPTRVLSLRATEGYLAENEPRFGNRLLVHALVKFDTEQSLEIYSDRGVPLHTPAAEEEAMVDSEKKESWRVPAQRKRVTEYLVMEKRMWVLGPWVFREQIWPTAGLHQ